MSFLQLVMAVAVLVAALPFSASAQSPTEPRPRVVLKLDDFRADRGVHQGWDQTFAFLNTLGVTASIGVIGEGLEEPDEAAAQWLIRQDALGHELWNHGYCHCQSGQGTAQWREFRSTDAQFQTASIRRTQWLAQDRLGITLRSFGAPYNSTNAATAQALSSAPDLTVWMFKDTGETAPADVQLLPRIAGVNIEYPVHVPDFDEFVAGYARHRDELVLVIQGHPQSWVEDPARFTEFQRIIEFLIAEGAEFVTPVEAAGLLAAAE